MTQQQTTVIYFYKCFLIQFFEALPTGQSDLLGHLIKSTSQTTSLIRLSHSGSLCTFSNHPRTRYQTRNISIPHSPLKLLRHPKPAYPLHPFLPMETVKKELAGSFLPFLCLVNNPGASFEWACVVSCFPSEDCQHNKLQIFLVSLSQSESYLTIPNPQ